MGTFARLFNTSGGIIPKHKRNEFAEKIEKIFQVGGMMEIERVQLYGKKISMLRKARMHENGMDFYYNYFEDDNSYELKSVPTRFEAGTPPIAEVIGMGEAIKYLEKSKCESTRTSKINNNVIDVYITMINRNRYREIENKIKRQISTQ